MSAYQAAMDLALHCEAAACACNGNPWWAAAQEERGFPDINIITEKIAFQGITRFEDRGRMPLGSVFNVTSFSARILSQAMYNPKVAPRPRWRCREPLAGHGTTSVLGAYELLTVMAPRQSVGQ